MYEGSPAMEWGSITNDHHISLLKLIANEIRCKIEEILDLDLYLYDHQPAVSVFRKICVILYILCASKLKNYLLK